MSTVQVTVSHPGAHEPSGETFKEDFSKALTKSLHDAGLKRASDAEVVIDGYTQTSGEATVYTVSLDTEESAAAAKAASRTDPQSDDKK